MGNYVRNVKEHPENRRTNLQETLRYDRGELLLLTWEEAIKRLNRASSSAVPLGQTVIIVADMLRAAEECPKHLVVLLNAGPTRLLSMSHCCHATNLRQDA